MLFGPVLLSAIQIALRIRLTLTHLRYFPGYRSELEWSYARLLDNIFR